MRLRLVVLLVTATLVATACTSAGSMEAAPRPSTTSTSPIAAAPSPTEAPEPATEEPAVDPTGRAVSPLAARVSPLGSARYDPADHRDDAPAPISISIGRLEVEDALVRDVGIEPNGDMELPGADAVGWYRFNPKPGQEGSSVLAAHISFNGTPGVFRYLSEVDPGDRVVVGFEDGSHSEFEIVEVAQYDKQELPLDRIFAKTGEPVLTLITCGGDFNRSLRSYEDNFVAYAVPVGA